MIGLNRSLMNRKYILINVLKALASIISICSLHVILLSKITQRLINLVVNFNLDNLYIKPGCHIILKPSLICKNTADIDC
jgi:hypothetical protein